MGIFANMPRKYLNYIDNFMISVFFLVGRARDWGLLSFEGRENRALVGQLLQQEGKPDPLNRLAWPAANLGVRGVAVFWGVFHAKGSTAFPYCACPKNGKTASPAKLDLLRDVLPDLINLGSEAASAEIFRPVDGYAMFILPGEKSLLQDFVSTAGSGSAVSGDVIFRGNARFVAHRSSPRFLKVWMISGQQPCPYICSGFSGSAPGRMAA